VLPAWRGFVRLLCRPPAPPPDVPPASPASRALCACAVCAFYAPVGLRGCCAAFAAKPRVQL